MKPPNITPPPPERLQTPSQQPPPTLPPAPSEPNITATTPTTTTTTPTITTNSIPIHSPVLTKPQTLATTQVQQAPLALTTQPQIQASPHLQTQTQHQQQNPSTTQSQPHPQIGHLQDNIQAPQLQAATTLSSQPAQPLALASAASAAGPTALVLIPQLSTTTSITPAKAATISTPITSTVNVTTAHVTLAVTTQSTPIQLQAPITTHVSNITSIPMTAHQQSTAVIQPPLANRPPSTLPIVPINTTTIVKTEPNKYICCLLDNGARCDRVAGNASFSARIQKIVGTKKMNFALDPTVRHAYICEHHKAIITVAKKSTTLARDTKSNAKNHTINNNANTLAAQSHSNFNDLSVRQQTLQHPVNMELLANQNRLANNHSSPLNNMPIRQGTQIAYSHYQSSNHPSQVGSMDVMMSSSFDNAGGDSIPSSSRGVDVDLQQLQVNTLRRYKRHFRVQTRPGLNKMQLAESLKDHFRTLPIIEKEAITYFVYIVKCCRNKLDHHPKAD